MVKRIWRSCSSLRWGSGFMVCIQSGEAKLEYESLASKIWTSDRLGRRSAGLVALLVFLFSFRLAEAATAVWVTLFLKRAISIVRGCSEEWVRCWIVRDLKGMVSRLSMKAPNAVKKIPK